MTKVEWDPCCFCGFEIQPATRVQRGDVELLKVKLQRKTTELKPERSGR
jgi:hypothetical protein